MAVFIIGDLHLSLGCEKPMDVFQGWQDYVPRLEKNWRALVAPQDTVVLAGDTSWGMKLEESLEDFRFLEALPGRKVLLKGNHDYWWTTAAKMAAFFEANGLRSFLVLHNQSVLCEDEHIALCGTRGWLAGQPDAHSGKVYAREVGCALRLLMRRHTILWPSVWLCCTTRPSMGAAARGRCWTCWRSTG